MQKANKALIRFVILLLIIQFATPSFALADARFQEKSSYHTKHASGITELFLKENSEEKIESNEKSRSTHSLIDFSFHAVALNKLHTKIYSNINDERRTPGPLFKLLCVFLI